MHITMGAGVLPISIYDGKIYFLFSREEKNARDGGLWSDFGGRKDKNETYRETAIRECYEEANGILGSKIRITKLVKHAVDTITLDGYKTYISVIGYDSSLPKKFRDDFLDIKKNNPELVAKNGLYEKDMLKWISFGDLKKNIKIFRPFYRKFIKYILDNT
jgi:8-oxo-dGTP pyrophosphatase MutT (NUDIX family)